MFIQNELPYKTVFYCKGFQQYEISISDDNNIEVLSNVDSNLELT